MKTNPKREKGIREFKYQNRVPEATEPTSPAHKLVHTPIEIVQGTATPVIGRDSVDIP